MMIFEEKNIQSLYAAIILVIERAFETNNSKHFHLEYHRDTNNSKKKISNHLVRPLFWVIEVDLVPTMTCVTIQRTSLHSIIERSGSLFCLNQYGLFNPEREQIVCIKAESNTKLNEISNV
ncbi:hypothetical protein BpHYR1_050259 [Brachionus plicatilis]|uniref:Uncharacterized protein n=1 Tax=Brachionus plicatilis TaxID=10195 RepID=A0A3M7RVK8_BRAPC|nr:hypothetical protein BpHYR1_050259 [Brachionus plicatilis]